MSMRIYLLAFQAVGIAMIVLGSVTLAWADTDCDFAVLKDVRTGLEHRGPACNPNQICYTDSHGAPHTCTSTAVIVGSTSYTICYCSSGPEFAKKCLQGWKTGTPDPGPSGSARCIVWTCSASNGCDGEWAETGDPESRKLVCPCP